MTTCFCSFRPCIITPVYLALESTQPTGLPLPNFTYTAAIFQTSFIECSPHPHFLFLSSISAKTKPESALECNLCYASRDMCNSQ